MRLPFQEPKSSLTITKDSGKDAGIIGHFGLGFYSAFMVADKVEIITKSYSDAPAVQWSCDRVSQIQPKKGKEGNTWDRDHPSHS